MNSKIDTKEKFTIITPLVDLLYANLTAGFVLTISQFLDNEIKNIVLNLCNIKKIDEGAANNLVKLQQKFYDNKASFVICEIDSLVEKQLDNMELLDLMNITPSESEAFDIVQMEEIERELLKDGEE